MTKRVVVSMRNKKKGSIREALDAIYEAGGKAWDDIDDPDALIAEMRGNPAPPALTKDELIRRQKDVAQYNADTEEDWYFEEQFDEAAFPDPEAHE